MNYKEGFVEGEFVCLLIFKLLRFEHSAFNSNNEIRQNSAAKILNRLLLSVKCKKENEHDSGHTATYLQGLVWCDL